METKLLTLESGTQRLELAPALGGSITRWDWKAGPAWTPLFRPWDGKSDDRYTFACFPLVPWSNRITQGGFEQNGQFHPMKLNKQGESYPIHGDGWLQAWHVAEEAEDRITLAIESDRYDGNPYHYRATQTFQLDASALHIALTVTHLGAEPMPYGLGLHPYFVRNDDTLLHAPARGVWLAGSDPIPVRHTEAFPDTWDYNQPASLKGPLIDNCFTGWPGWASIHYPDRGLTLKMSMEDSSGYSLMYRPPELPFFCFEPITQPIDSFHMPGRPGLQVLDRNQSFTLDTTFAVSTL